MKRLTEYISELLHSQIDPNMCRDLADVRPPVDKQSITSKNDIIHVEFEYKDKIYKYDIKYNDLDFGTSENIHWHVVKVEKGVTFDIHAQKSGTGKYNATIINMIVDVKKKDKKIDEITPHCQIYSYDENNNPLNIDIHNI